MRRRKTPQLVIYEEREMALTKGQKLLAQILVTGREMKHLGNFKLTASLKYYKLLLNVKLLKEKPAWIFLT